MHPTLPTLPTFVLHWNRPAECAATVASLLAQRGVSLRITVLDNGSKPENLDALRAALPAGTEIRAIGRNLGWGGAFNEILRPWADDPAGNPDDLCCLSAHDALLGPGCLQALVTAAGADPRVGIACPRYHSLRWETRFTPLRGVFLRDVPAEPPADQVQPVPAPHGTLLVFRRGCLREIGVFDPRYFAYGDEHDLGLRANRAGWTVALVWAATVVNPGTWTPSPVLRYLVDRNSLLLVRDHAGWPAAIARAGLMLGQDLRLRLRPGSGEASTPALRRARWRAVRDFVGGRFGAPPTEELAGANP